MDALAATLIDLLRAQFLFYYQAHAAHWNVEGESFAQFHALFSSIYEDAYGAVDPLAELVRARRAYAPPTLLELGMAGDEIPPVPQGVSGYELAENLLYCSECLVGKLNEAYGVANSLGEQGVMNFLAGRIETQQKWSWQLRATVAAPAFLSNNDEHAAARREADRLAKLVARLEG